MLQSAPARAPQKAHRFLIRPILIVALSLVAFSVNSYAQRDQLTDKEQNLVREAQELPKRTEVFIKAIDRRMLVISVGAQAAAAKQSKKELELWGEMPTGTRAELFSDIARILDEAITNIDDAAERSPKSPLLKPSLQKLNDAATRLLPQLTALRSNAADGDERERLEQAIENAQAIIEAAKRNSK